MFTINNNIPVTHLMKKSMMIDRRPASGYYNNNMRASI